jgi:hemolysin activation/secretion protein
VPLLRSGFRCLVAYLILEATIVAASDEVCVALKQIDINDELILGNADLQALRSPFLNQCIDADLIRRLLSDISNRYIELGYVTTRPYLQQQDVSDGQISVEVIAGKIEAVINAGTGVSDGKITTAFAFHDSILNLRSLETALETIQRVPSVNAEFEIRPGSQQGQSIVAIKTTETNRLHLAWGVNAQTDLDGRFSLRASLDNPLNINDILEINLNDGEVRETFQNDNSGEIIYSFPVSSSLITLSHSEISFEQRLQGINESFLSSGETRIDKLQVRTLIARGQSHKLNFGISLELKDTENFFEDEQIDVSSYRTSQTQISLEHEWFLSWGQLFSSFQYHKGLDSYGARDDDYFAQTESENNARLQFGKYIIDNQLLYYFDNAAWHLNSQLLIQYSDDILFNNDQISLGSPFTVRGYSSALSGSNAWYWHSDLVRQLRELSSALDGVVFNKTVSISVGLDYGKVKCESDNPDICGEIYGWGTGINIADKNFNARLSWGQPLKEIGEDIGDKEQYYLDLMWRF